MINAVCEVRLIENCHPIGVLPNIAYFISSVLVFGNNENPFVFSEAYVSQLIDPNAVKIEWELVIFTHTIWFPPNLHILFPSGGAFNTQLVVTNSADCVFTKLAVNNSNKKIIFFMFLGCLFEIKFITLFTTIDVVCKYTT